MPFRDIAGHRRLLLLIARAAARVTLPQSMLFAGPRGVGKHQTATALAQALNCLAPAKGSGPFELDACGVCASCQRITRRVYPDVIVVEPGESGSIKIDHIRDVIDRTAFRPFEGRTRVVIVDNADAMVTAAQNALLKTLEEPPSGSIFILISAIPDALLPTVRSRCSLLRFGTLTITEVVDQLIHRHGYTAPDARAAAAEADGSMALALERRSADLIEARTIAQRLLEYSVRAADPVRRLDAAELIKVNAKTPAEERNRLATSLRSLRSLLRDIAILATQADSRLLANPEAETDLRHLAASFDDRRSRLAFAAVEEAIAALERNASPKLVADWVVLQL